MSSKLSLRRMLPVVAFTGCLLAGAPILLSQAQTNSGISFTWGEGPTGKQQLRYVLSYGTPGHMSDTYRLKLGKQKLALSKLTISYPDYYDGTFNASAIELQTGGSQSFFGGKRGDAVPLAEVEVDKENHLINITPQEVIPAGTNIDAVLKRVQNPNVGGMYYFNCRMSSPGDVPLLRYCGTWILSIFRS